MPGRIKVLDSLLASKIAAGEVIERPASIIKELLENSLDAGATSISVHAAEGGKRLIRVADNGEGIAREDAPFAFLRHATSKISKEEDLDAIRTMGFRGEALASIAAVSMVHLRSRRPGEAAGTSLVIEGGGEPVITDDGCPEGTSIEVKDLFYNTPARLKFLRSTESEFGRILDIFKRIALINPGVRFRLIHGSSKAVEAPAGALRDRIRDLFAGDVVKNLIEVKTPHLCGYIGTHELTYPTAKGLFLYVNGRSIRDKGINRAIMDGYGTLVGHGRYPFAVLDLKTPPEDVDVNIHPAKSEVRFKNPKFIYDIFKTSIKSSLGAGSFRREAVSYAAVFQGGNSFAGEASFPSPNPSSHGSGRPSLDFQTRSEDVKSPEFLDMEPVGQLWGEFLIAQSAKNNGEFFLIDQHGAAERSAFERLKKNFHSNGAGGQMLLIPERIETTPEEREAVNAAIPHLKKIGFDLMAFGPSIKEGGETFLIKSVPDILSSSGSAKLVKDIAEEITGFGGSSSLEERIEAALMRIACHSVIRGRRTLSREEAGALLKELSGVDFASHCPHGRPVVKRFTRSEVESMFKR